MICILSINAHIGGEAIDSIDGWIIAHDVHDARRQAENAAENDLASALYAIEFPRPGKHQLPTGHIMLVS